MAVTITKTERFGPNGWKVSWNSDLPNATFYVYQDGRLVDTTSAKSGTFTVPSGESLVLEVLDDPAEVPEAAYPGKLTLGWFSVPDAKSYRIDEYLTDAWVERKRIAESGQRYYQWKTRWLEDSQTHQFRIVPIGLNGNAGTPLAFSVLMVRHPDPPDVDFSYSADSQTVTIS